jgi:hypothetical protein
LSEELLLAKEENLYENGYVLPDLPERYFAIERSSGDIVWAYGAETFESLAAAIDASETAEVDDIDVWDLDTRTAFIPAKKTVAFFRSNQRIGRWGNAPDTYPRDVRPLAGRPRTPDVRLAGRSCQ